jgi:hypothetical protein
MEQQILHLVSTSFGDIQKAQADGIWQFGNQPNVRGLEPGAIVILKVKGVDEFYVVGLSASGVRAVSVKVDWPSETDMGRVNDYAQEFSIAPVRTPLAKLSKSDVENALGIEITMNQGCIYTADAAEVGELMKTVLSK